MHYFCLLDTKIQKKTESVKVKIKYGNLSKT